MGSTYNVANDGKVTITNDLAVDIDVLKVDTSNNRVGINVATPLWPLDINGDLNLSLGSIFRINGVQVTSAILSDVNSLITTTLADGKILIGDTNNVATARTLSGDVTVSDLGITAITGTADVTKKSLLTTKGDIFVASGNAAPTNLGVGTNGRVLTANSVAILGVSWDSIPQSGHIIEYSGSPFTQRLNLNFTGSTVTVTDDPGNNTTIVNVSGNASGAPVREDFVATQGQTTFTVVTIFTSGREQIYRNGQLKRFGASYDYTISGQDIVFNAALDADDKVSVVIVNTLVVGNTPIVQSFAATSGQTTFTVVQTFSVGQERVFSNGIRKLYGAVGVNDYYISGQNIIFNTGRNLGDSVVVEVLPTQPASVNIPVVQSYVALVSQQTFAVAQPFILGQERVFVNGIRKLYGALNDYTISSNNIQLNVGRKAGDVVVVEVLPSLPTITAAMPQWQSYTISYSNLAAASLTNDIELFPLSAGAAIHNVVISHNTSFTNSPTNTITAYTVSVGIVGSLAKYASAFDVFQAPSPSIGQVSNVPGLEDKTSATSIRVAAVSVGANLNTATTGSVTIKVLASQVF